MNEVTCPEKPWLALNQMTVLLVCLVLFALKLYYDIIHTVNLIHCKRIHSVHYYSPFEDLLVMVRKRSPSLPFLSKPPLLFVQTDLRAPDKYIRVHTWRCIMRVIL